jgi:hypothetical protein
MEAQGATGRRPAGSRPALHPEHERDGLAERLPSVGVRRVCDRAEPVVVGADGALVRRVWERATWRWW